MKEMTKKATPRESLIIGSGKANIINARILKLWRFNTACRLSATGVTSSKPWQNAVLTQGSTNRGYYIANLLTVKGLPASLGEPECRLFTTLASHRAQTHNPQYHNLHQ